MTAKEAYDLWKSKSTIHLRVYTDEQMFEIGYNFRNQEIDDLQALLLKQQKKKNEKL